MLEWITQNFATLIALAAVLALVALAVFSLVKDKKRASGGCTGNCASCGLGCSCGKKKK
ncbi:MAG: FeoB-associated Cys-rich membrane protein [Clostridia bacterium]|nr:FeoB-associated Cys-rich membrane protein [Clostridia bacterium]